MIAPRVGLVGLGLLGSAIGRRLLATGCTLIGHDLVPERVDAMRAAGMAAAGSPAEVAAGSDTVLICVTTSAAVAAVVRGEHGICSAIGFSGKHVVDHSTTEIGLTRELAAALAERTGAAFIDAPVSGGPGAAESGSLAIMAGGDAGPVERVRPLIERLGRFTHMGDTGAGQATKLVNQTLVLTNYCVIAEALRLAQHYGVDASRIPHALAPGHAGSNLLPILLERMIAEDFSPRGYARQVLKDLEMLNDAAAEHHLAMPMAGQAVTLFRMLVAQGKSELDGSAVVSLLPKPPTC
jgi:3-hydroxyisobutyrate dehydrogenase